MSRAVRIDVQQRTPSGLFALMMLEKQIKVASAVYERNDMDLTVCCQLVYQAVASDNQLPHPFVLTLWDNASSISELP